MSHVEFELYRYGEGGLHAPKPVRQRAWAPRVDLTDLRQQFVVTFELAGVTPDQVKIIWNPDRNAIAVRGVRVGEPYPDGTAAHRLEIEYGEFYREVELPDVPLRAEAIKARMRNGMLVVVIPKDERAEAELLFRQTERIEEV